jgi:hypothetical protein
MIVAICLTTAAAANKHFVPKHDVLKLVESFTI